MRRHFHAQDTNYILYSILYKMQHLDEEKPCETIISHNRHEVVYRRDERTGRDRRVHLHLMEEHRDQGADQARDDDRHEEGNADAPGDQHCPSKGISLKQRDIHAEEEHGQHTEQGAVAEADLHFLRDQMPLILRIEVLVHEHTDRHRERLGADVTVLYRKTQEEMPAIKSEYEDAVKEGVKFEWKTTVEAFLKGKNGRLGSCVLNTPEGERVEKFDRIYLAIGSRPANRIVSTTAGIEVDEKGYVKVVERPFGMTTRRGVFAGGDVVHRPQTVVLAMKAAKEVAQGIAQYVDAIKLLEEAKRIEKDGIADVE